MSNLFVKNIPSIQEREFKFRSAISSEQLNAMQNEAFNDILDLFNKANQLQKIIYEVSLANNIEAVCYTQRLQQAMTELNKLNEAYNNLTSVENSIRTMTKYAFEAITDEDGYAAVVDSNTNDIVSRIISSKSKIRLYDDVYEESLVSPSLQAYIGPDSFTVGGNIYSIEDSDINNAFDGSSNSVWFRKVITTPDVNCIENEIVIGLPEDIITTRVMNQITINPFPIGYLDIMDIQYKSNGAWKTIPGFETHVECTEETATDIFGNDYRYNVIKDAPNLKFNFQELQSNQLKIKLRQRHYEYDAEHNRRIWYLGLRDVDVVHNIYTRNFSEFDMVFEFPETERNIKVYDAEVIFNNPNITNDMTFGVTKEYYYYDSEGRTHKIPSTCPFILQGHKMRVKFTIDGGQLTPNIHKCIVKYKLT